MAGVRGAAFEHRDVPRKVFLILDDLDVHKAKAVREWLEEHVDRIEVFYFPPCPPELSPTEHFNGDLKGEIRRGVSPKDVDPKRTMLRHFRRIPEGADARACVLQKQAYPVRCVAFRRPESEWRVLR